MLKDQTEEKTLALDYITSGIKSPKVGINFPIGSSVHGIKNLDQLSLGSTILGSTILGSTILGSTIRSPQSLWRGREVEGENTELTFPSSTFLYQSPPHAIAARHQSLLKCLAPPPSPSSLLRQQERGVRSGKEERGNPTARNSSIESCCDSSSTVAASRVACMREGGHR